MRQTYVSSVKRGRVIGLTCLTIRSNAAVAHCVADNADRYVDEVDKICSASGGMGGRGGWSGSQVQSVSAFAGTLKGSWSGDSDVPNWVWSVKVMTAFGFRMP